MIEWSPRHLFTAAWGEHKESFSSLKFYESLIVTAGVLQVGQTASCFIHPTRALLAFACTQDEAGALYQVWAKLQFSQSLQSSHKSAAQVFRFWIVFRFWVLFNRISLWLPLMLFSYLHISYTVYIVPWGLVTSCWGFCEIYNCGKIREKKNNRNLIFS